MIAACCPIVAMEESGVAISTAAAMIATRGEEETGAAGEAPLIVEEIEVAAARGGQQRSPLVVRSRQWKGQER